MEHRAVIEICKRYELNTTPNCLIDQVQSFYRFFQKITKQKFLSITPVNFSPQNLCRPAVTSAVYVRFTIRQTEFGQQLCDDVRTDRPVSDQYPHPTEARGAQLQQRGHTESELRETSEFKTVNKAFLDHATFREKSVVRQTCEFPLFDLMYQSQL